MHLSCGSLEWQADPLASAEPDSVADALPMPMQEFEFFSGKKRQHSLV
jgi:hypothetical protein